eukprot:15281668-Alexandrium_andersonii.AAC.1
MHNTTLASELAAGTVVDIAGQTAFAGPQAPLMTCRAHGSVRESRRDYVLVAQPIVGWVRRVRAIEGAGYDVHKPLEVVLQPPAERLAVDRFGTPAPFRCPEGLSKKQWAHLLAAQGEFEFACRQACMHEAIQAGDVDTFWEAWSDALRSTFVYVQEQQTGREVVEQFPHGKPH